jgi:hypothetical protein
MQAEARRYPETLRARVPRGLPAAVEVAARKRHTNPSEWIRQKTLRALEADGITLRDGGEIVLSECQDPGRLVTAPAAAGAPQPVCAAPEQGPPVSGAASSSGQWADGETRTLDNGARISFDAELQRYAIYDQAGTLRGYRTDPEAAIATATTLARPAALSRRHGARN